MVGDNDRDKLDALAQRIEKAESATRPAGSDGDSEASRTSRGVIKAVRLGSDFVALVVGAGIVGWFADKHFGLAPWIMLGSIVIGFVVGFWMIVRVLASKANEDQGATREAKE